MVVGIIIGALFIGAGLAFLVTREPQIVAVPIVVTPIDEVPIEDIDQVEVILPGNADQLITVIGV